MIEKIHIIIPLFAAIIVAAVSLVQKDNLQLMEFKLIFTIVFYYIFGVIIRSRLRKMFDDDLYDGLEIYNANIEQEETSKENLQ